MYPLRAPHMLHLGQVYISEAACIVRLSWACVQSRASQTSIALCAIGLLVAGAVLGNDCYSFPRELVMWGVSTDCLALAGAGVTQCFACQNRVVLAASWRHQLKLYSTARRTRDAITPVLVQMAIWAMLESAGPYLYGLSPHALLGCLCTRFTMWPVQPRVFSVVVRPSTYIQTPCARGSRDFGGSGPAGLLCEGSVAVLRWGRQGNVAGTRANVHLGGECGVRTDVGCVLDAVCSGS